MNFPYLADVMVPPSSTLAAVLRVFDDHARHTSGIGIVLVVDAGRVLLGTATEGDVRRALLAGKTLQDAIEAVMERHCTVAVRGCTPNQLLPLFDRKVRHVPLVDETGVVIDLVLYSAFEVAADQPAGIVCARAPMRMSFAGGGSDLSHRFSEAGGAVVSVAISKYGHAIVESRDDGLIRIRCEDTGHVVDAVGPEELVYDGMLDLQKAAIRLIRPGRAFTLRTYSDLPKGSGLGGSSALMVAVIAALAKFSRRELSRAQIADVAFQAERIELEHTGGWQDQYAAAFGGLNLIEFEASGITVTPVALAPEVRSELESGLLLCQLTLGRNSSQIQALSHQAPVPDTASQSAMAYKCLRALVRGDLTRFGAVLTESWRLKRQLGAHVATPEVDAVLETGLAAGAAGGKLLGAGGGGHVLLFAEPRNVAAVVGAVRAAGYVVHSPALQWGGVEAWQSVGSVGPGGAESPRVR